MRYQLSGNAVTPKRAAAPSKAAEASLIPRQAAEKPPLCLSKAGSYQTQTKDTGSKPPRFAKHGEMHNTKSNRIQVCNNVFRLEHGVQEENLPGTEAKFYTED